MVENVVITVVVVRSSNSVTHCRIFRECVSLDAFGLFAVRFSNQNLQTDRGEMFLQSANSPRTFVSAICKQTKKLRFCILQTDRGHLFLQTVRERSFLQSANNENICFSILQTDQDHSFLHSANRPITFVFAFCKQTKNIRFNILRTVRDHWFLQYANRPRKLRFCILQTVLEYTIKHCSNSPRTFVTACCKISKTFVSSFYKQNTEIENRCCINS